MIEPLIKGQRRPQIKDDRTNISQERLDEMADNIKLVGFSARDVMERLSNGEFDMCYQDAYDIAYEALYQTVKERHYETRPDWRDNYIFINHFNLKLTDQIGIFARKRLKHNSLTKTIEDYNLDFNFGFVYDVDLDIEMKRVLSKYSIRQKFIIKMIINREFIKDIKNDYKEKFGENLTSKDIKFTHQLFSKDMGENL